MFGSLTMQRLFEALIRAWAGLLVCWALWAAQC
jgi:hypothetical protein